eukprot:g7900.t1
MARSGSGPSATTSSREAWAARVRAKVQAQLASRKSDAGHDTPAAPHDREELFTDGERLFARTTTAKNSSTDGRICVSEVGLEWLDEIEGELQHVDDAALDGHDTSTNLLEGLVPDVLTELCAVLDTNTPPTDFLDDFIASLSLEELEELTLGMTGCSSSTFAMQELLDDEFLDVENDLLDPRMRFDDEDDDDESSCEEVFESDDQVEEDVEMLEETNGRKVEVMSAQHDAGAAAAPGELPPAAGNTLKADEGGPSTATAARQSTNMAAPKAAKRRAKTSASIVTGLLGEVNHDGKQILSMDVSKVPGTNLPEILATAGADKAVKLWRLSWMEGQAGDLDEGDVRGNTFHVECLASLSDHYETVNVVRWHPTEAVLASGGADGNVMFYKLVGGGSWRRTKAVRFQSSGGVACEVTDLSWTRLGPVVEEGIRRTTAGGGRSTATSARPVRAPAREILVTTDNGDLHIVDYVTGEKKHRISVSEETVASFQLTFKLRREQQERQMFAASQGAEKLASGGMGKDHTGFLGPVDPSAQMLSADDIADGLDRWVGGQIDPWGRVIVAMNCSKKGNLIPFVWRWSEKVGRFEIRRDIAEGCWSEMSQENRAKMIFSARPNAAKNGLFTPLMNLVHYYAPIFARDDWSQPLLELRVPIDRITHVSQGPICKMKVPSADHGSSLLEDGVAQEMGRPLAERAGEDHRSTSAFRKVRVPPKAASTQKIQEPAAPAPNYELFDVGTTERDHGENPKKQDSCSSYHYQPVSLFATVSNRNNVLSLWSSHKEQALLTIGNFIPENEGLILDLLLPNDAQSVYMTTNTGAFFFVRRSRRWLKKATKLNVEYFEEEARKKVVTCSTGMNKALMSSSSGRGGVASVNTKTNKAAGQEPPSEVGGATLMTRLYDAEIPESVVEIFEGGNHGPPDHVCDQQHLQQHSREFKVASCFPGCGSANTTAYNDLLKHLHNHKGEFPAPPTKNLRELFLPESTLGRAADPSEEIASDVGTECARLLAELSAVVDIPVKEILRTTASSSSTPSKSTSLVSVVEDIFATAATCGSARDPRSSKENADHLTPVLLIGPNGKLLDVASSSPGANDDDLGDLLLQEHDGVAVLSTLPDELVDATLAALESGRRAGGAGGGGDHQVGNLASGREQQPKKNANEAISIRDGLVLRSLLQEFAADSSDDQARAEIHTLLKKALQPPAAGGASSSRGVADLGESQRALKLLAANKEEVERVEALEQTESETVENKGENENHNHHNLLGATSFRESDADPSTSDHGSHLLPAEPVVHVQTGAALGPSSSSSAEAERRFVVSRGHMLEVYEDGVQKLPATTTPIPLRQLTMSQNSPYLIGIGIGADGARRAPSHPRVVIFDMNLCAVVVTAPLPVKRPKRIFVLEQTDKADDSCPLVCVEADLPLPPPPTFSTPSDVALQEVLEQEQQLLETLGAKDALSALDWRKVVGRDFVERSRDGVRQIGCCFAVANCLRLFEAARHFAKGVMMHYGGGGAADGADSWSGGKELEFVPCTTTTKAPSRAVTLEVPLACSRGLAAVEEEAGDAGHDEAEQFSSHLGGDILRNVGVAKLGNGEEQRKIVVRLPEPEAGAVEGQMAVGLLDGVGGDVNMMDDGRKRAKFAR